MAHQLPSSEHKVTICNNTDQSSSTTKPPSKIELVQRAQWLRAAILGANDGLLSTATLMLGVSSAKDDRQSMIVSGIAGTIAGAFSMALGEYVSVSTQRDIEEEVNRSQSQQVKPVIKAHVEAPSPGRSPMMRARAVMIVTPEEDDDREVLPSPVKAAAASGLAFTSGSALPLISSAFIGQYMARVLVLVAVTTIALAAFGAVGARLGGSRHVKLSAVRVLVGGWVAMGITYWLLKLLDRDDHGKRSTDAF